MYKDDFFEMLGLRLGIKKIARINVVFADKNKINNLLKQKEFHTTFLRSAPERIFYFYLSKSKKYCELAMKLERQCNSVFGESGVIHTSIDAQLQAHTELGYLSGYPECCIRHFSEYCRQLYGNSKKNSRGKRSNLLLFTLDKTKKTLFFTWKMNNINIMARNKKLLIRPISHFPCTYSCNKSLFLVNQLFLHLSEDKIEEIKKELSGIYFVKGENDVTKLNGLVYNNKKEKGVTCIFK